MEQQILKAQSKDVKVEVRSVCCPSIPNLHPADTNQKVILIGGFAGSVSLRRYLRDRLNKFCRERNCPLPQLLHPNNTHVVPHCTRLMVPAPANICLVLLPLLVVPSSVHLTKNVAHADTQGRAMEFYERSHMVTSPSTVE